MPGRQLPWRITRDLLNDAAAAGIWEARFYGGEPLLHPDLPRMIEHAASLGMDTYVTTNAILLGRRAQELYDAGLRTVTIGYYGTGAKCLIHRDGETAVVDEVAITANGT